MGNSDEVNWHPTNYRTHTLGEISSNGVNFIGSVVTLCGFGEIIRGKGGVCFIKLRDGTGQLQAFIKKGNVSDEELDLSQNASRESTFQVTGEIAEKRPPRVPEGEPTPPPEYEIVANKVNILSLAKTPMPLGVTDKVEVGMDVRLDNRFLDLRRKHINAMFKLRSRILQYGREHLISEGFGEINSPKIIAAAAEGGTNLFPIKYFERDAYLSQSPQLYKQLAIMGNLERVFEIGPAFRAEKHDTYRHLNEFISFDIEMAWANDEDVMCVQERMISHIWSKIKTNDGNLIEAVNEFRISEGKEPVVINVPPIPFPRVSYCEAIELIRNNGVEIKWGDDIEAYHADILAEKYPGFYFLPKWPMSMKPFYIFHDKDETSSTGGQLSRGFDLNFGRDEMTSGGQREHRANVLTQNLIDVGLNPEDFDFYVDGFRYGAPPHAGWGLGVARLLMILTDAGNVRETVLFPRDRKRCTP